MEENKSFKPYIPAEKITPEFTVTSIVMGIILAIVFGAANAYLGLRVGMTVSASIPAAVISMGVIRVIYEEELHIGEQYGADHRFCGRIPCSRCNFYDACAFSLGGGRTLRYAESR